MIQLTRLNNSTLVVNSDLIKFVEQAPDTVITLLNGEKLLVREAADEVMVRVVQFRRSILEGRSAVAGGGIRPLVTADTSTKERTEG
jgi:flagellar protein FlbD